MENHGDKNCKQVQGEGSARKMDTGLLNLFATVSTHEEPTCQFLQFPTFTSCKKEYSMVVNLREGCVKKTIAPAVSKAE